MRKLIPAPVIAALSDVLEEALTHAGISNLLMHAGAPGDPPQGNKQIKVQEWLRRVNRDYAVEAHEVLGRVVEPVLEADCDDALLGERRKKWKERVEAALARSELQYVRGGVIASAGALGPASRSLNELIRGRDLGALNEEFTRAARTVDANPREAVSAACNILESVCKVYIHDEKLDVPAKQDLQGVWGVVRKHLNFDPAAVEDRDLKEILSGLLGVVSGIGALRTHASSAHGAGRTTYRLEPRHARLAVHAAHTIVLFVLESWDKRREVSDLRTRARGD
jgi:hypothetical protein